MEHKELLMSFGEAMSLLEQGRKVARVGWNGKGMWLTLVRAGQWQVADEVPGMEDPSLLTSPWIGLRTADGCFVPWTVSQTDLLAKDWVVVVIPH